MIRRTQQLGLSLSFVLAVAVHTFAALEAKAEMKDTCSIVSPADVESVLGEPVSSPQRESIGPSSTCRFLSSAKPWKTLSVMVMQVSEDMSSSKMSERLKRMLAIDAQTVDGVGDDAAWGSLTLSGNVIDQMLVRTGKSTLVVIFVNGLPNTADTMNRVKILAQKVVLKL